MPISIRRLAHCLGFDDKFAIRTELFGWLSPPPYISLLQQLKKLYCYRVDGVPDIDQRWNTLPGQGANYCVPAAEINWLYYLGIPPDPRIDAIRVLNLTDLGIRMHTDADHGTNFSDGIDGLTDWLDQYHAPAIVTGVSIGANIRIADLRAWASMGGLVGITMGRYHQEGGEFKRVSSHRMTMVGLHQSDAHCEIIYHNPDDDGDLTTQSLLSPRKEFLVEERRNLEGDEVTVPRFGNSTNPYFLFIDGFVVIVPFFALTNPDAGVLTFYQSNLKTLKTETKSLPLPFAGRVVDLAIHPGLPRAAVTGEDSQKVWILDLVNDTWKSIALPGIPTRLSFGGRMQRLFVAQGQELIAIDDEARVVQSAQFSIPIEAITYDARADLIIVASAAERRIIRLHPNLQSRTEYTLVGNVVAGRLSLTADLRDGIILMSQSGSPEISKIQLQTSGPVVKKIALIDAGAVAGTAEVSPRGKLYVTEDKKIAAFDLEGNRLPSAPLVGLPAGQVLQLARSQHNFDPKRYNLPNWREKASQRRV